MRNPCDSRRWVDPSVWELVRKVEEGWAAWRDVEWSRVLLLRLPLQGRKMMAAQHQLESGPKLYCGEKLAGARVWGGSEWAPHHMKWTPEVKINTSWCSSI